MKTIHFILLLIIVAIFSHLSWFNFSTVLTYGDWYYWPNEAVKELYYSWGTWIGNVNLSSVNVQIPFNLFMLAWSFVGNLGGSYDLATKLTLFIPIAFLNFLSPYILAKKLTNDNIIAFAVALFYGTTTYGIANQTPIQFVYALAPLILYLFLNALKKNRTINWLFFDIVYWVGVCYEVRMMYILSIILGTYFLLFKIKNLKKYIKNISISIFVLIGLNLFWLMPIILGGLIRNISTITDRGLFGTELLDLSHAITLFNWLWTGGYPNKTFVSQSIIWYFWIIPFIVFFVFVNSKKFFSEIDKEFILFFSIISLVGIFLTKETGYPFPHFYDFLYAHFPGFNLFREASKFYLIISIGYLGLISYSLLSLKKLYKQRKIYFIATFIVLTLSFINIKPLVTGEIGGLFVPRQMPKDYLILKNRILKDNQYFRTLWIPRASKWGFIDNSNPRISMADILYFPWEKITRNNFSANKYTEGKMMIKILNGKYGKNLIDLSSVKYIIVPNRDIANDDDFIVYYGEPRSYYVNELNKMKFLQKIDIGTKEVTVYVNNNYRPHIYLTKNIDTIKKNQDLQIVEFRFKNPTEYKVQIKNLKDPVYLNFSESYNNGWKLRVGDFTWHSSFRKENYYIPDEYHFQNDAGLNSFYINPSLICKDFLCRKNSDGSYDINITLFFSPQSYFYLGSLLTILTLFLVVSYLLFFYLIKIKNANDN